jgi:hypothetical protein
MMGEGEERGMGGEGAELGGGERLIDRLMLYINVYIHTYI